MSLLSAILPVKAALGAVSTIARAVRPGHNADFAATLEESLGVRFTNRWDADKNGTVTPDEFPGKHDEFARWDLNTDGSISAAEAHIALLKLDESRRMQAAADESWALYDADQSGGLTATEAGLPQIEFGAIDTNQDGLLDKREWSAANGLTETGSIR